METIEFFQLEKNKDDIRKTVLTNLTKMLTERKLLDENSLANNINMMLNFKPDDETYTISGLIGQKNEGQDNIIIVKIYDQKVISISKQSPIAEFVTKNKDKKMFVIFKEINTKSQQYIINISPTAEIFKEYNLMINLIDYVFVPRYEKLNEYSDDFINFRDIYHCKKRNIPKLLVTDPLARYYGLKRGDIVRIIRASETTGLSSYYRLVV